MEQWIDLKPNRLLLDSEFEGYRLSLDKLSSYHKAISPSSELLVLKVPLHQYSLQHVKAFTSHNHLIQERWNESIFYFVTSDFAVNSVLDDPEASSLSEPVQVFSYSSIHDAGEETKDYYNPTLVFPSKSLVILADGRGRIWLLDSGEARTEQQTWKVLYTACKDEGFLLYDSLYMEEADTHKQSIVLLTGHVEETDKQKHCTAVSCITLSLNGDGDWTEETTQVYRTSNVEYVSLDSTGHIYIASSLHRFTKEIGADGDKVDVEENGVADDKEGLTAARYIWLQADDDITLTFALDSDTAKSDVEVVFSRTSLCINVKGKQLLSGSLHKPIATGECTWTISGVESKRLEVFVSKAVPSWWTEFIDGDTKGEMITDPEVAERIHQNLDYLTTDTMEEDKARPAVNSQLEACDMIGTDATFLCKIPCGSQKPVSIVNFTGCTWLYYRVASQSEAASFCTRHDVDGLLWSPSPRNDEQYNHTATFNALGYVQASKVNRRFITSPADHSYAAIADTEKHVYVYRQVHTIDTDMRNRKTGRALQHISVQQVISLDNSEAIHGLSATNHAIYILTSSGLYKFKV